MGLDCWRMTNRSLSSSATGATAAGASESTGWAEDSPVTILHQLEQERGRLFTEKDYQEMRHAVLEELAYGARLRPFTIFTFAVLEAGLATLLAVGVETSHGHSLGDYALAWLSGLALLRGAGFFWGLCQGIARDRLRTLDERLQELAELRDQHLVTAEEYQQVESHILHQRQRSGRL